MYSNRLVGMVAILLLTLPLVCFAQAAEIIDSPEYILYFPSGLDYNEKYPLVIALHPGASAQAMIDVWTGVAEEYKWIILASKEFRNNIDARPIYARIISILKDSSRRLPIDTSKIIASGFSGGGMGSHSLAFLYPDTISAVIINTGMINEYYMDQKHKYPKWKIAVFLASPNDFRYNEMQRDQIFLQDLGWRTKWIEFEGGHRLAPLYIYRQAAKWLTEQFN